MESNKRYVTQLTRQDLCEIADAANSFGGDGINVARTQAGLEISIDKEQLSRWIRIVATGGKLQ